MDLNAAAAWIMEQLLVPGTAVGVLLGLAGTVLAQSKGYIQTGSNAKAIADLKAENAKLVAELQSALERVEELAARLAPWEEFQGKLMAAALAEKVKGSGDA